jgi:hypothetical protein
VLVGAGLSEVCAISDSVLISPRQQVYYIAFSLHGKAFNPSLRCSRYAFPISKNCNTCNSIQCIQNSKRSRYLAWFYQTSEVPMFFCTWDTKVKDQENLR